MTRLQIIVSVAAIGIVVLIYNLPKVILNNNKVLAVADSSKTSTEESSTESASMHAVEIPAELQAKITVWKKEFATGNKGFSDSLSAAYTSIGVFDSAAYFAEQNVDEKNEVSLLKVAEANYRAFGFATNAEISNKFAVKARGFYEKVLALNPGNKDAKSDMAMTFVTSENPMQGIMMLREIVQQDPKHVKSQLNLGMLSVQSKQFDKALARFETVLEIDPNHVEAAYYKGVSLLELGKIEEAKKVFNLLLDRKDIDPAIKSSVEAYLKEIV